MPPYIGEIRLFAGNFAPAGWSTCEGQLIPISDNDTLFNLIGTTYGGDGESTFALPNLSGRVPIHQGQGPGSSFNYLIGEIGGVESTTLNSNQIPIHAHSFVAATDSATGSTPLGNLLGDSPSIQLYVEAAPNVSLAVQSVPSAGGSQPHDNLQPYLSLTYIISMFGIFPTQ
ncbi:MAG: tail fiber protein [bacterium]